MAVLSVSVARPLRWPLIILLVALVLGLTMVFLGFRAQGFVSTKPDPYYFGEMGKSLARGEGFAPHGILIHRRAPLYPLAIGALYTMFGEHLLSVELFQCLLFAGTCLLVFDMGRRLFNERTGAIAGLVCALHPMMLRYVPDLHLETMLTFLFTLTLWLSLRFYQRATLANGALLGGAAALASLTKAVVLVYPAVFAVGIMARWLAARQRGARGILPLPGLAAMFAAMGLLILPWTVRNYRASGHFVLISTGMSDAILRGLVFSKWEYALLRKPPYTDAENECNDWFGTLYRQAGDWEKNDWDIEQILNRTMKEELSKRPWMFVRKFFVGLLTFWYQLTSLKNSVVVGALAFAAWVLAFIGWRRARREGRPTWLLLTPVLYLNVLLAALLALGRYSAPVLPALLIVSAYGVDTLLSKRRVPARSGA